LMRKLIDKGNSPAEDFALRWPAPARRSP
jgi:hypothetical protein